LFDLRIFYVFDIVSSGERGINFVDPLWGELNQFIAYSLSLTGHFYFMTHAQTVFGNAIKQKCPASPGNKLICGERGTPIEHLIPFLTFLDDM